MDLIKSPYDFNGKKVLILGLGILGGGIGMARYCARHGATLRITDLRSVEHLRPALAALSDLEAEYVLGEHRAEDIDWADIVIRNPGVPPSHPLLRRASSQGKPIDMEMAYFIRHCPARMLVVTGTKGKTSTTSILYSFLRSSNPDVGLAGNMGESAIDLLDNLRASDEMLLEVSSYQLEGLLDHPAPVNIALITNVGDDHLDRYGSIASYRQVKASVGKGQTSEDWLILPGWDEALIELCAAYPSRKVLVHAAGHDGDSAHAGPRSADVHLIGEGVSWTGTDGKAQLIADLSELRLLGSHNRVNVAFAAAAAHIAGRSAAQITGAIGGLEPVAHRLQPPAPRDRLSSSTTRPRRRRWQWWPRWKPSQGADRLSLPAVTTSRPTSLT